MIELAIVWLYLAFLCISFGGVLMGVMNRFIGIDSSRVFKNMIIGWCITTVICEYISLVLPINKPVVIALAVVALLVDVLFLLLVKDKRIVQQTDKKKSILVLFLAFLIVGYVAVTTYTAPMFNPADTYGYHIQAVKWIEEYGCVKGIANLISRLGFNNSVWCFYALGSMKGIIATRMHCALGFVIALFGCYFVEKSVNDISTLFDNNKTEGVVNKATLGGAIIFDLVAIAYVINNAITGNEYFSDQPANLLVAFILLECVTIIGKKDIDIHEFAICCVACVFLATIKVSMALFVLLAVWPIAMLARKKQVKSIVSYSVSALLVGVPFVIRNIIVSGRILYPSTALDIFDVSWKIPAPIVDIEQNLVYSFARDRSYSLEKKWDRFDFTWLSAWIGTVSVVDLFWVIANFVCIIFLCVIVVRHLLKKKSHWSIESKDIVILAVCSLVFIYWFVSAPDSRFIKLVLWFVPVFVCSQTIFRTYWDDRMKASSVIAVVFCVAELACSQPIVGTVIYLDSIDNLKYLVTSHQEPFESMEGEEYLVGNNKIYYVNRPADHELPCMSQETKLEDIQFIGDNIRDGFNFIVGERENKN